MSKVLLLLSLQGTSTFYALSLMRKNNSVSELFLIGLIFILNNGVLYESEIKLYK